MRPHHAAALCLTLLIAAPTVQADVLALPAQTFTLDPSHSAVWFEVSHLSFSMFTASFDTITGALQLDPAAPEAAELTVTIPVASLDLPAPPEGFFDTMMGELWFDAGTYPEMTFTAERIERTGDTSANIHGTLTLRGQQGPLTLETELNGGYDGQPWEPWARIGFSATATLSRSAWGMDFGVAGPDGFGVGDTVTLHIETEWTGEPRE